MAEFQEVVRNRNRLCAAQSNSCADCVLDQMFGDCEAGAFISECAAEFERTVMDWAAQHPEPQYPTWNEWYKSTFTDPGRYDDICPRTFMKHKCSGVKCVDCRNEHIPPDIAKKLGIKPKEVE